MVVTGQKAPGKGRRDGAPEGNTVLGRTSLNQPVHPKGEGGREGRALPLCAGGQHLRPIMRKERTGRE